MTPRSRLVATLAAAMLVASACGASDEPAGATDPGTTGAPLEPAPGDGPNATISPDVPDELVGQVGPVEVVGAALPELAQAPVEADPALGSPAPVIVGVDFDGTTVRVDAAANGPTLVVFLAHWCPHCNNEVPRINELRDAGSLPADLDVVAVSTAIDPTRPNWPPSEWLDGLDWTFPAIADGVDTDSEPAAYIATRAYGVDGFPFATLIDADGNVAARWSGEHETAELLELITSNLV